jgi:hypothetical protein
VDLDHHAVAQFDRFARLVHDQRSSWKSSRP